VFDHKNFALNGLFPGLVTTRSVANLGHFEIEVTITSTGGGGAIFPLGNKSNKYKVRIRVTRNGKTWEYESEVGSTMAKVIAKVMKTKIAEPSVSYTGISMAESREPQIKVTTKH